MNTANLKFAILCSVGLLLAGCSSGIPVATGVFETNPEWTFETNDTIISTPIVYEDAIIVRTDKQLYVVEAATRKIRSVFNSPGNINGSAPPIIADGIALVPEDTNPFIAFDLVSGQLLWRKCFLDPGQYDCSRASPGLYIDDLQSSQGIVIVSDFDGDLTAYEILTGIELWKTDSPGRGGPSVVIDNDSVYFDQHIPGDKVQLWAVNLKTGALQWSLDMPDVMGKLTANNGVLYYSTGVGDKTRAVAITEDGKSIRWDTPVDGGLGSKDTYLSLDGDTLYVSGNQLTAIEIADGTVIWRKGDRAGYMRPIPFQNMILVRDQHLLYAFDRQTGAELGRLTLELAPGWNNVELNAAVYGDLVLIPVGAKRLAAYRLHMPKQ